MTIELINNKKHSRFKISRLEMFNLEEKKSLKPLPGNKYELCETKFCKVHPDGTIALKQQYYSVPYQLIGETVFTKTYAHTVEIYHRLEKISVHPKLVGFVGRRSILSEHIPEASQVYRSTTVQSTIQQAYFISKEFKSFIEKLLSENPSGNLRRAQGFVREARAFKAKLSSDSFKEVIIKSISEMERFNQIRVQSFKGYMKTNMAQFLQSQGSPSSIVRDRSNPMLRGSNIVH